MKSPDRHFDKQRGYARLCVWVVAALLAAGAFRTALAAGDTPPKGKKPADAAGDAGKDGKAKSSDKGAGSKTSDSKESDSKTTESKEAGAANAGLRSVGEMIPLGSRSRGVRLPAFDNGKPSSLIVAAAMTRVDDSHLFAEKMTIEVYGEAKADDLNIRVKTGTYDMDEQILSSTERSRVSRSDFQIEGDGMVFDTKTSQGKMVGNVEMIIFDADQAKQKMGMNTTGNKPGPEPAATPKEAATKPEESKEKK